jgi:hypothetical protein
MINDLLERVFEAGPRGGIGFDKFGDSIGILDCLHAGFSSFAVSAENGYFCAGLGETFGHGTTKNTCSADDHGDFGGEVKEIHFRRSIVRHV